MRFIKTLLIMCAVALTIDSASATSGISYLRDHSCHQTGSSSNVHFVGCGDLYETLGTLNDGRHGAFFWGRGQIICAYGNSTVECDGAKGLTYVYVSGYGWSQAARFACGIWGGHECSPSRNYFNNPRFAQAHPHPGNCWTLIFQFRNVTVTILRHTLKLADWVGPQIYFCPKHN